MQTRLPQPLSPEFEEILAATRTLIKEGIAQAEEGHKPIAEQKTRWGRDPRKVKLKLLSSR